MAMRESQPQAASSPPSGRWFHPTPGRFVVALLAVEGILLAVQWLAWLHKGYGVLIAIACIGVFMVAMLRWWSCAFPCCC
jgi:hypothetical protein